MIKSMLSGKVFVVLFVAMLFLSIGSQAALAEGWTGLYNGSSLSAGVINSGETRAQKFNASNFANLRVCCPSWGNNTGNLTLTLYRWNMDYSTTISGVPIASRTFVNFPDNSWLEMGFQEQPSGDYLWVLSNPTETVGIWALLDSTNPSTGYYNGSVTGYDYKAETYLANPPLTASIIAPFLGRINTTVSTGQRCDYWAAALRTNPDDKTEVMYLFDWGDGTQSLSGKCVPNTPGDTYSGRGVHRWSAAGTYQVKARAYDAYGAPASNWSPVLNVTVTGNTTAPLVLTPTGTTASSQYSTGTAPSKVMDNDSGTFWSSSGASSAYDNPQWIKFDLGGIKAVDSMKVTARSSGTGFPVSMKMQYSNDGSTWFDLPIRNHTYYPNPGSMPQMFEAGGISARYLRLYSDRLGFDGYAHYFQIAEVKIYGNNDNKFYSSAGGQHDANINNMWTVYGTAANETNEHGDDWWNTPGGIIGFGSTEWHYWNGLKLAWTNEEDAKSRFKGIIYNIPMDADGYLWADAYGKLHLGVQKHNVNNMAYVLGAYEYYRWTKDTSFLTDTLPAYTNSSAPPLPTGISTLIQKLRKAMDWCLTLYGGSSGLFTYTDAGYEGLDTSHSANYWDDIPFGYKDAYANALFYQSLKAMGDLEEALGNSANAAVYRNYMPAVKTAFNNNFWNAANGRYIATIDSNGTGHDFGFTYLNFMAVEYGLADLDKSRLIYNWVDGKRIVNGDTSTGSDIYNAFKYAARSNTKDIASSTPYWWCGEDFNCDPSPTGNYYYGGGTENGGAILYTSFDDILGRIGTIGSDSAYARLQAILNEFQFDELRRDRLNSKGYPIIDGIIGEFPESGLMPAVVAHGFLGISAKNDGLHIAPKLPTSLSSMGVKGVKCGPIEYRITADRSAITATITSSGINKYDVVVPNGQEIVVLNGSIVSTTKGFPRVWADSSTTYSDSVNARKAIDIDSSTFWSTALQSSQASTQWISVDLGAAYSIGKIRLTPRQSGYGFPIDFKLQYSTNGSTWNDIPGQSYTGYTNPGSAQKEFTLSSAVNARYVRIYATKIGLDNNNYPCMQFAEIGVE